MSLIESERPVRVEVRCVEGRFSLFRDDKPFFVKGAGGFEHIDRLAALGGNSVRTWGIEQTEQALPEIRRTGLSLCAGLWMVPPRQGFDYADAVARQVQLESLKQQVLSLRDEPSLLVWGVGNELELGGISNDAVWRALEEVAAFIKEADPLHPVMTVLASPNEEALNCIQSLCPSIDFVSVNSYGDLEKVQSRLSAMGWERPYLVTEWGANGHWEVPRTSWGAEIEPTSTEKAEQVRRRYLSLNGSHAQCLGSYVFLWGSKQETTPTWYGLFSANGRATESVEAIGALWRGEAESGKCPRIGPLRLNDRRAEENVSVLAGETVVACFDRVSGVFEESEVIWSISQESVDKKVGGDAEEQAKGVETAFDEASPCRVGFSAPEVAGCYRLYLEVLGPEGTVATANFPFRVI